ncbi:unnamed protein product [Brassica oleracea]|uniref:Helitron helicase-like domain-containing protein n=1 Tax=Brassica oleracea TaxID=3712 RepID=A0A3P6G2X5_BRAOL|nr:unnamed protein product [Brassica oleracea]
MMKRKRGNVGLGIDTAKRKRTPTINEIPNLEENHSFSKSISNQDIPLISIYFRLLETIEGHKVSSYTIPPYQQISMLSPQTPRNLRRLVLEGLHERSFKSIKSKGCHKRKSSCNVLKDITNISHFPNKRTPKQAHTFNASTQTIEEDDELVGNDLFGGIVDEDNDQVFECSSQENTDTENEDSDLDDPIVSEEQDDRIIITNKAPNSERPDEIVKASKQSKSYVNENDYLDEGDPDYKCDHCGAIMWYGERLNKRRNAKKPTFSLCCMQGQVQLPLLKEPPSVLKKLLEGDEPRSRHFQKHIRPYNMVFSFTSLGGRVERSLKKGRGPDMFQLQGENYHLLGNLTPPDGSDPKFGQLYIVDTKNEVENRSKCLRYNNKPSEHILTHFSN